MPSSGGCGARSLHVMHVNAHAPVHFQVHLHMHCRSWPLVAASHTAYKHTASHAAAVAGQIFATAAHMLNTQHTFSLLSGQIVVTAVTLCNQGTQEADGSVDNKNSTAPVKVPHLL